MIFELTHPKSVPCGQIVKCDDLVPRYCVRKKDHAAGCNPFSDRCPICSQNSQECKCA